MSLEDFQLIDSIEIDNSIIKRDFTKIYHNQVAQLNNPVQNIDFIFGENSNYHQVGNRYLQYDIIIRKAENTDFDDADVIRLVNNGFGICFQRC